MKNKYLLFLLIYFIFFANIAFASDFYPELGIDPFYSSLNPNYNNKEEFTSGEFSVLNWFKNKTQDKSESKTLKDKKQKKLKKEKKHEKLNSEVKEEPQIDNQKEIKPVSDVKETFVTPEVKKPMTKREKEKALWEEEREKRKAQEREMRKLNAQLPFKERFLLFLNPDRVVNRPKPEPDIPIDPSIELTADVMEYYPDNYEVEAIGNAKVKFTKQNTILSANKIVYNYDRNILKAHENVVLSSQDSITEGDFIRLDLTKPEGWIENPVTTNEDIKIDAKEAYIYPDKIEEYEGVAKILRDEVISVGASSFAGYVDQSNVLMPNPVQLSDSDKGYYSLKAKTIYIDAKDDHDTITIKNADLYFKKKKVAVIPSLKIVTNKNRANVESNLPEFGSVNMLGMHLGPAVVLNVPGGSTLKLAPIVTYAKDKFGIGGIARFRNETNMTEAAYGTSRDRFLLRGRQKIAPGLMFNYSSYTNQNEWFMGYRMPKYSAQLSYSRSDDVKDLGLTFSQMYSAGAFVDRANGTDLRDTEGRFRWMTQSVKPIYKYINEEGNVGFATGLVAQTAATAYTTGDVTGLFRIGPSISTKVGPWNQSFVYYQSAIAGNSPFDFDRYRYGRSNFVVIESLKLCKYLTVGYLASIAMNREVKSDDTFQENRVLLSVGPDYAKVTIGYDSIRHNTMLLFSMLLGMEDSEIEFDKSVTNNPDKIGKEKKKARKKKKKNYKKYLKESV